MTGKDSKDWIELFLDYTDGISSPEIYRLWAAISCVAGLCERRVWIKAVGKVLYPNLYILLVGAPGAGKTFAIEMTEEIWRAQKDLKVAPHDMTKAALVDNLLEARRIIIQSDIDIVEFHSLQIAADEFGVFVPSHDLDFLSTLNRMFDCPAQHTQDRRGFKEKVDIVNPQLNILAGTQPAFLANLLPDTAWGMGFMSRVIMIFSGKKIRPRDIFNGAILTPILRQRLSARSQEIFSLYGQVPWTLEAAELIAVWNDKELQPIPEHSKLEHYNSRRLAFTLKLCLISAISAGHPAIQAEDFNRARDWLLGAEQTMPDVFREMVHKSDSDVISELHFYAWNKYMRDQKPIHEVSLYNFLSTRVHSERISRIIDVCVKSNILDQLAGTSLYRPRPRHEHGVEE